MTNGVVVTMLELMSFSSSLSLSLKWAAAKLLCGKELLLIVMAIPHVENSEASEKSHLSHSVDSVKSWT
jgi:hypothetical protein